MSIEFIKGFGACVPVTYPVFTSLHSDLAKLDGRIEELLEMFSEQYNGLRNVRTDFAREWGYVVVASETMKEMGFNCGEFISPVPFVLDEEFTLPNIKGEQIHMTGWGAGLTIMFICLEEYITFCTYTDQILEVTEKEDVIKGLNEVLGGMATETVIKNAIETCQIIGQIGSELCINNMYEVIN